MDYQNILFKVEKNVGHITLNRPEAANTIHIPLALELMDAAIKCDEDPEVRAVLITGAGKFFCAGGDIKTFTNAADSLSRYLKELTVYLHATVSLLVRMDPPVIAAVQGNAAGAGFSLVCGCDIVLASEASRFTMAYTAIGLTPDGGGTYFLPRLIGLRRTQELALTNRTLTAQEALDWGIVTRVVPEENLFSEAESLAVKIAAGPTKAFGATKRLLYSAFVETFESQMAFEAQAICEAARQDDAREGISAFLEKRKPQFKGR